MGGIEIALILVLRIGSNRDIDWPQTLMAVLAAVLLALGVSSHFIDIYRHRSVRGISFIFVAIDALGDLTSLISVLFEPELDILGLVIYGSELFLWMIVFACGGYYNLLPYVKAKVFAGPSRQPCATELEAEGNAVALHDMPSSTSVFRTRSASVQMRRPQGPVDLT